MKTLEKRIDGYKKTALAMQKELNGKTAKVSNEYKFNEKSSCDHCGRYIINQRLVTVDGKKQWWGLTCAGKAHCIELFLNN